MKIKVKLSLGLAFLFAVIVLLGGMGAFYLNQLANDSKKVIQDNYLSVKFMKEMLKALESINAYQTARFNSTRTDMKENIFSSPAFKSQLKIFEENLKLQKRNITEIGEQDLVNSLSNNYSEYLKLLEKAENEKITDSDYYFTNLAPMYDIIRGQVFELLNMNMEAIIRKSENLQNTAKRVTIYLSIIGLACIIISLIFIIRFPAYISKPINSLINSIIEISKKNYEQRLDFKTNDEFQELAISFNQMAEKLNEYEHSNLAKILFEKRRNELIIHQMKDAIIGLDEHKNILFVNPLATKLLGLSEDSLVGKYAPDVASTNDLLRNLIHELMTGEQEKDKKSLAIYYENEEQHFTKELIYITKDSSQEINEKNLIGYVLALKNITQFHDLDEAKTNFIATISHELKTPLSSIKMSLKLLEDSRIGKLNQEQTKLISNVREESQRLSKIVGELLDLSQVETGNIKLTIQEAEPAQIISYATDALKFQTNQKNINIETKITGILPKVQADLDKSVWVMANLLSNAIKYSPEKSKIIISAFLNGKFITFSVQDFGIGIEKQYQERIFERFFQVPHSDDIQTGTGLGLAISKEFIEAQGGKIWVESERNHGSKFSFSLPIMS
jgi:PAS domain S-box-containing protein